jgi:hypothetical protein
MRDFESKGLGWKRTEIQARSARDNTTLVQKKSRIKLGDKLDSITIVQSQALHIQVRRRPRGGPNKVWRQHGRVAQYEY